MLVREAYCSIESFDKNRMILPNLYSTLPCLSICFNETGRIVRSEQLLCVKAMFSRHRILLVLLV